MPFLLPVFSVTSTLCALLLGYVGLVATTDAGAIVALAVSGVNAIAALLTGYVALRQLNKRRSSGGA